MIILFCIGPRNVVFINSLRALMADQLLCTALRVHEQQICAVRIHAGKVEAECGVDKVPFRRYIRRTDFFHGIDLKIAVSEGDAVHLSDLKQQCFSAASLVDRIDLRPALYMRAVDH